MNILFIGDIVGRPGRELVRRALPVLTERRSIDLIIANVENSAAGFGVTAEIGETLQNYGVEVMTGGNHIWDKKEAFDYIERERMLVRPANYPPGVPGRGSCVARTASGVLVGVINVMGRAFMLNIDNPFSVVLQEIEALHAQHARVIFVDFHAEATSEKMAMGWHLAGKVTAIVGTHTHVQTADEQILPGGTAYISDVGMTGPHDSIIGFEKEGALSRFLNGLPSRFEPATGNPKLHAVIVTADADTGRATGIERLRLTPENLDEMRSLPTEEARSTK